jgi:molecular chaperone DnaK (HSP70)
VGSDEYHGVQAKNQLIRNPSNTVAYFRDFLGVPFDRVDPTNCHACAHPVEDAQITGFVIKTDEEEAHSVSVHKIAVRHLDRLRESAADFIGKPIDGAVIAVPTDYNEAQRAAIVNAAAEANLKIIQVINEPTAALLAHVSINTPADKIVVVADFGGTRSDGGVFAVRGGIFTILATLHDYELGGKKLDDALVDYVAKDFEKQHGIDPKTDSRAVAKLTAEAESAKITLSNTTSANFAIDSVTQGFDYHTSINRLRFELTGRAIFNRFVSFVEELIAKAKLDVLDIDEVLLVGGCSSIPKVASSIESIFDDKVTKVVSPSLDGKAIQPDELIARGAAIQASLVSGYEDEEIAESLQAVVTVAPHLAKSIGVRVGEHHFVPVIGVETLLPIRKTVILDTAKDVADVLVAVYEGESEIVVTKVEKELKKPKANTEEDEEEDENEESDWSSDEEDEETRHKHFKPATKLAELGLKGITGGTKVEVILNITRELRLQIAAREVRSGGLAVRGECSVAHIAA